MAFSSFHTYLSIACIAFLYLRLVTMKRYSNKEPIVFLWVILPYILFMNLLIFGFCIYNTFEGVYKSFAISVFYFLLVYAIFGTVAVLISRRISASGDLFKRIAVMLPVFYVLNIVAIYGIYTCYNHVHWMPCKPLEQNLWYTILYACVMSTVITFINEGMANWEKWKSSVAESEKLRNSYQRSKLLGLKGQINPHFLFNCFNTLSGLIHENEEDAIRFLDEMTKVHRYLLRSDEDYLVSLEEEIKFAQSYLYLTKARFGQAIQSSINIPHEIRTKLIPPLSMQVILENIIYTNALNKKQALQIHIYTENQKKLIISHTLHEKTIVSNLNLDEGLDNLVNKYRLLNEDEVEISDDRVTRKITLPLIQNQ